MYEPEIVTLVFDDTFWVLMLNFAVVCPACTFTLLGTEATELLLLESVTTTPPDGAAALRLTTPSVPFPPLMLVSLSVSDESVMDEPEAGETVI